MECKIMEVQIIQNDKIVYIMKKSLVLFIFSIGVFVGVGMGLLMSVMPTHYEKKDKGINYEQV